MKTFFTILVLAVIAWGGWYFWDRNQDRLAGLDNDITVSNEDQEGTPISFGQGGEGSEDFEGSMDDPEEGTDDAGSVNISGNTRVTGTVQNRPVSTVTRPAPTATPAPIIAFRTIGAMNGSAESGNVVITSDASGRAVVNFNLAGAPPGIQQPAFIYRGASCESSSEVAFRLNPLFGGGSTTTLPISASELLSSRDPLVIVVHKSGESRTEMETRYACGTI